MGNNSKINASEIGYKDSNNNMDTLDNILSNKSYKAKNFSNISCPQNTATILSTLTLTKGVWVVVGHFGYNGNNLRYFFNIGSYGVVSSYDNGGIVAGNVTAIINVTGESLNLELSLWPTDKNITVDGNFKAIKYI